MCPKKIEEILMVVLNFVILIGENVQKDNLMNIYIL